MRVLRPMSGFLTALTIFAAYVASAVIDYKDDLDIQYQIDRVQIDCLARNIYHEARGEGLIGQIAVGNVTMNRVKDKRFPETVCKVVYQPWQFSWTAVIKDHEPKEKEVFQRIYKVAEKIYYGNVEDITSGATFYHATWIKQPSWAKNMQPIVTVDQHIFYRG